MRIRDGLQCEDDTVTAGGVRMMDLCTAKGAMRPLWNSVALGGARVEVLGLYTPMAMHVWVEALWSLCGLLVRFPLVRRACWIVRSEWSLVRAVLFGSCLGVILP